VANSSAIKLHRQATAFAQIATGSEASFVQFLAGNDGAADAVVSEQLTREALTKLRDAVKAESGLVIIFGAELRGNDVKALVDFGLGKGAKFICLADYANSRGAADMGLYPICCRAMLPSRARRVFTKSGWTKSLRRQA